MAFNIDPSISLGVKGPQPMTLGDMMNIAGAAQAYKQRQQLNPLEVQKAQAETELAKRTLEPKVTQEETKASEAKLGFQNKKAQIVYDEINAVATDPRVRNAQNTPEGKQKALQALIEAKKRAVKRGIDETEAEAFVAPYIQLANTNPQGIIQGLINSTRASTGATGEAELINPKYSTNQLGQIVGITPGTGAVNVAGGGQGSGQGGGVNMGASGQNMPGAVSGQTPSNPSMLQKNQLEESQNAYLNSVDMQNNPNSKLGHLPTKKLVTDNIINLLKDPDVDTGPITNYFATNTGQESLTFKEQELAKYLEQRIQNQNPSSQMDLQSKHTAYGSINLKKEALLDLIRNEKATQITTQDLLSRGIIKNGGNPVNPNLNAVNNFKSQFAQYANDPTLMKFISLTGENPNKAQTLDGSPIDDQDKNELNRLLTGMTKEQKQSLLDRRSNLLRLVNGNK